jgi:hypothetical protein
VSAVRIGRPANYLIGKGENPIYDHDPQDGLADEFKMVRDTRACFTSRSIPAGPRIVGESVAKSFGHLLTDPREFDNCAVRSRHGRTIPLADEETCLVLSRPNCRGRYTCTDQKRAARLIEYADGS